MEITSEAQEEMGPEIKILRRDYHAINQAKKRD
jgi:hypothetical protein